ncbi:MAG: hypothetical protein ABJF10_17045 [Chthoniobacter sp.]|uniref:hypothetical protein n=1 Tax=Chthoniobacter sp. TaxID=2510640 RepID=UPI0032AADDC6
MNRRKSSVYTLRLDFLYLALILILLVVRLCIDRAFDRQTEAAVLAQPLFWFLCALVSLPFGVFGLHMRCGLRLQFRFLVIAVIYFSLTMFLDWTGLPTLPLFILTIILALYSLRFWHRQVVKVLSFRAFRMPGPIPTAGDMGEIRVRPMPRSVRREA